MMQYEYSHADRKRYVRVTVDFDEEGKMHPVAIQWPGKETYLVDRVMDVAPMASRKAGGFGTRYTVRILGKITYLYHEPFHGRHDCGKWFVEAK